ncbi:MAG: helix-turn-helix transcriptional regulator [Bacteroidota bacterium]
MQTNLQLSQLSVVRLLDRQAKRLLSSEPQPDSYTEKVIGLVIAQLRKRKLGIEVVADDLSMSVRSLQMKLKEEGTSYQKLLNRIREQLAIAFLQEKKYSKSEIADLLGFSEISVFSRTFKKWTGQSPSEFQLALSTF